MVATAGGKARRWTNCQRARRATAEIEELRASRARVARAAVAERRRIERELHDGVQQHLVALVVNLQLARELADSDPPRAITMLEQLSGDVREALECVRALAHGIYPPLLSRPRPRRRHAGCGRGIGRASRGRGRGAEPRPGGRRGGGRTSAASRRSTTWPRMPARGSGRGPGLAGAGRAALRRLGRRCWLRRRRGRSRRRPDQDGRQPRRSRRPPHGRLAAGRRHARLRPRPARPDGATALSRALPGRGSRPSPACERTSPTRARA